MHLNKEVTFMLWKKSAPILSVLGIALSSTAVYAHVPVLNENSLVTIPNLRPGFEFSVAALALQPGASNLNYVIYNKELPVQSPSWDEREINPGYSAAFALGAGYIFPGGKDVTLDWTHLNSSGSANVAAPSASYFLGPDYEIGPDGLQTRNASGSSQFKYDVINLSVGQFVDFGRQVQLRFFGGLSNAYLREQVNATYSGTVVAPPYAGPFSTRQEVTANFTGLGPRVGIGATYETGYYGIGFLGEAAASALVGSAYSKAAYLSSAEELKAVYGQNTNSQYIKDKSVTQIIPGFDAKLGLSYKYTFNQCTTLTVKAGYQAAVYVNAISQYIPASLVAGEPFNTGGIFVATMSHTLSNYSVQGPFLEAKVEV